MGASVLVVGLLASGCGGDDSSDDPGVRDALVDAIVGEGTPRDQAECWADELDGYSADDFLDFVAAESADEIDLDFARAVADASGTCAPE